MATNPYKNKVVYNGQTLIDLTGDTVAADKLLQGYTAHDASGAPITGTAVSGSGSAVSVVDTQDSAGGTIRTITAVSLAGDTVAPENLLTGYTAHNSFGQAITGTASGGGGGFTPEQIAKREITGAVNFGTATSLEKYLFKNNSGITSINAPSLLTVGDYALSDLTNLTSVSFPLLTTVGQYFLSGTPNLETIYLPSVTTMTGGYYFASTITGQVAKIVVLPSVTSITGDAFRAGSFAAIDIGPGLSSLPTRCFYSTNVMHRHDVIILRKTDGVVTASTNTTLQNATTVYVPQDLISSYQSATNWSAKYSAGTLSILPIEGSQYENYYADGTPIS